MKSLLLQLVYSLDFFRCCWCFRRDVRRIFTIVFLLASGVTGGLLLCVKQTNIFVNLPTLTAWIFTACLIVAILSLQIVFVACFIDIWNSNRDLSTLKRLVDWLPSPVLRKRVNKLLADQEEHVVMLKKSRRVLTARWIVFTTWILVGWYVLASPVTALTSALAGVLKGAGD